MTNTTDDVFDDTICPVPKIIPEERERFASISTKNLETFEQYTDSLCSKLTINGDPYKKLTNSTGECSKLIQKEREQSVQLFTMETKLKSWKTQMTEFKKEIDEFKVEIKELINNSNELSLEVGVFQKKQKSKYEAYMQALHYYKSHLNLYINIENSQENITNIRICFFSNRLSDEYMVLVNKNTVENTWDFVEANPKLPESEFNALKKRLRDTNDISRFVVTVRKIFEIMKGQ